MHYPKYIGIDFPPSYMSFSSFFSAINTNSEMFFFKIDIEGYEYRILDHLIDIQEQITGLVIEFHDCDLNLARIHDFIQKFNLPVVHIHANNFAPIDFNGGIPLVLEITFSRYSALENGFSLPHKLDMPNNPLKLDVILGFKG